ncbi:MAG: NlpC/P60 family protein [Pseudomonadota bacterium]
MWEQDYVGLRFLSGGRDRSGLDCWGLCRLVYRDQLGIDLPTYGEISANELRKVARQMRSGQDQDPWRAVGDPQAFDIAVMTGGQGRVTTHVGVMIDQKRLLHIERHADACVEPRNALIISQRILGFRRHAEVAA